MHKVVNEHPEDDKNDLNVGTLLFVLPTLIWSVEKSSGFLFRNSEKEHISHADRYGKSKIWILFK